jgi:hypothetical protein
VRNRVFGKVDFELIRWGIPHKKFAVYRRRTWTPSGEHWVTDYGIEVFGIALWVHLPFVDVCCRSKPA